MTLMQCVLVLQVWTQSVRGLEQSVEGVLQHLGLLRQDIASQVAEHVVPRVVELRP